MLIASLSQMEQLVQSNKNLFWDGWDVVQYKKSDKSQFEKDGSFFRGTWHKKTIFKITESGWNIPVSIGGHDV
jgi:hypothetical protein